MIPSKGLKYTLNKQDDSFKGKIDGNKEEWVEENETQKKQT